jgi:hypothetical protein
MRLNLKNPSFNPLSRSDAGEITNTDSSFHLLVLMRPFVAEVNAPRDSADRSADGDRCLTPQGDSCSDPAHRSATIGSCRQPACNSTSSSTMAPGLPRTKACGRAHGDPHGHLVARFEPWATVGWEILRVNLVRRAAARSRRRCIAASTATSGSTRQA